MLTMTPPDPAYFAEITREAVTDHDWDSPHRFATLTWNEETKEIAYRVYAMITPDVPPEHYPGIMTQIALQDYEAEDTPPIAYLLQIEAFGAIMPGKDATPEEKQRFDEDRKNRTINKRADAREISTAYCADVFGRVWTATRDRATDEVEEQFFPSHPQTGGEFFAALRACAATTGFLAYGQPPPYSMNWN